MILVRIVTDAEKTVILVIIVSYEEKTMTSVTIVSDEDKQKTWQLLYMYLFQTRVPRRARRAMTWWTITVGLT